MCRRLHVIERSIGSWLAASPSYDSLLEINHHVKRRSCPAHGKVRSSRKQDVPLLLAETQRVHVVARSAVADHC